MMIERLQLGSVAVYFTLFTPEEAVLGQQKAQSDAVKRIIRHVMGDDIELLHDPDGAPMLKNSPLHISISHCDGAAAVGFHDSMRIGIDIERPRSQLSRVRHKFLSPEETAQWSTLDELLTAWTIKEAAYKAAGVSGLPLVEGISIKKSCSVEVTPHDGNSIIYNVYSTTRDNVRITAVIP